MEMIDPEKGDCAIAALMTPLTCPVCGTPWCVSAEWLDARQRAGASVTCPNGDGMNWRCYTHPPRRRRALWRRLVSAFRPEPAALATEGSAAR